MISTVLWDFGGVILSSPFEAFNRYEMAKGIPLDTIRTVNSTNPADNAWARLERNEISPSVFNDLFATESANLGYAIPGFDVLDLLGGDIRPEMVAALDRVIELGYKTACLTNNMKMADEEVADASERQRQLDQIMARFDLIVESRRVGFRKPEIAFYEYACTNLNVTPHECVFLDDIGVNLKPAAAMGMKTIKVLSAEQALNDLEQVLGVPLR